MVKENQQVEPVADGASSRQRVEFPKNTLEEAIKVAQAIEDINGGLPLTPLDTAGAMSLRPASARFRDLLPSSNKYGLTKGNHMGKAVSIEPLGFSIVRPGSQEEYSQALIKAALTPEIFAKMFEVLKGKKIPEDRRFIQNTINREFNIPKEQTELCVTNFVANMDFVGLVRRINNGNYLSSEATPFSQSMTAPYEQTNPNGHKEVEKADAYSDNQVTALIENKHQQNNIPASSTNQRVFITHGKNQLIVTQLKDLLSFGKFVPVVAEEHETPSKPVSEKVLDDMRSCFAGVIHVASEDELLDKDGNIHHKINENVLIEIGAAMAIYKKNYVLLVNRQVHLPSNLQGLYLCYYEGEKLDYDATMKLLKAFSEFK